MATFAVISTLTHPQPSLVTLALSRIVNSPTHLTGLLPRSLLRNSHLRICSLLYALVRIDAHTHTPIDTHTHRQMPRKSIIVVFALITVTSYVF